MTGMTNLIEPEELARLGPAPASRLLICDCRFDLADVAAGAAAYAAGHIPGAVYLDLEADLSGAKTGLNGRHPLPAPGLLAARLAACGAGPETLIVAYDAGNAMFAARLWWLARWLGHGKAAVLNGGLLAWTQAGLALERGLPAMAEPGDFAAGPALVGTIDYAGLRAAGGAKLVIDARAADRFRGDNETLDARAGHIPGARNHFFGDNLDASGRFKAAATLRGAYLAVLGGVPAGLSVASCGSGVTACHNLLAMEVAGLPGGLLYPGSWSEWSAQPGAAIARGDD